MRLSDFYWDYDVVKLMDGYWKFDLRDHSFVVAEVQETFQRHVMPRCAYDVVTRHKLYSFEGMVWRV